MEEKLSMLDYEQVLERRRKEQEKLLLTLQKIATISTKLRELEEDYHWDEDILQQKMEAYIRENYTKKELVSLHDGIHIVEDYIWGIHDAILKDIKRGNYKNDFNAT